MINNNTNHLKVSIDSNSKTLQENILNLEVAKGVPFILEYTNNDITKNYIIIKDIVQNEGQNIELGTYKNNNLFKIETSSLPINFQVIMGIELLENLSPELCISFFIQIIKSNGELLSHYNTIDNMELRVSIPNSMGKILDVYRKLDDQWYNVHSPIRYIGNDIYIFNVAKNLEYQFRVSTDNKKTSSFKILLLILSIVILIMIFIFFYEVDLRSSMHHNVLFSRLEYLV